MIDRSLDDLQGPFDGSVKHGHGIAKASSMFQTFQNGTEALEGVVVVQKSLSKRFFGETGAKSLRLLNIGKRFFMGLCQRSRFVDQRSQFRFCMASSGPQITEFSQDLAPLFH